MKKEMLRLWTNEYRKKDNEVSRQKEGPNLNPTSTPNFITLDISLHLPKQYMSFTITPYLSFKFLWIYVTFIGYS